MEIKQEVRQFYDQVGWSLVGDDLYQNAHYEDLRPVSHEYLHRCHHRVSRFLVPEGEYFLDAGSGPIQYPEYLEYSRGYHYRVCADISITALKEARRRIGDHGLYVVADVANLPFPPGVFGGIVSLHTIHHLPEEEHLQAYAGLHRLLAPGRSGVIVNGWPSSPLMARLDPLVRLSNRVRRIFQRLRRSPANRRPATETSQPSAGPTAKGTFTSRHDVDWVKREVGAIMPVEIWCWRSASVKFLRAVIFPWLGGRYWLRLLFWLEELKPHYMGEKGQYPLIVIRRVEQS
jgi:SAM-dependent methyltransferase